MQLMIFHCNKIINEMKYIDQIIIQIQKWKMAEIRHIIRSDNLYNGITITLRDMHNTMDSTNRLLAQCKHNNGTPPNVGTCKEQKLKKKIVHANQAITFLLWLTNRLKSWLQFLCVHSQVAIPHIDTGRRQSDLTHRTHWVQGSKTRPQAVQRAEWAGFPCTKLISSMRGEGY